MFDFVERIRFPSYLRETDIPRRSVQQPPNDPSTRAQVVNAFYRIIVGDQLQGVGVVGIYPQREALGFRGVLGRIRPIELIKVLIEPFFVTQGSVIHQSVFNEFLQHGGKDLVVRTIALRDLPRPQEQQHNAKASNQFCRIHNQSFITG